MPPKAGDKRFFALISAGVGKPADDVERRVADDEKGFTTQQLVVAHRGKCPWFLYLMQPGGGIVFIETQGSFSVLPSPALQQAVEALFGEQTNYVKVDTTLPERARPQWARKSEGVWEE